MLIYFLPQNIALRNLPYANGAAFNSRDREHEPQCLPETRVELLEQIISWSNTQSGPGIFWLNGMAGTGKSTIARTIARTLDNQHRLGASFFFSRGQGDLGHARKLFTTLAVQLAYSLPSLKALICKALDAEYNIAEQGLSDQWTKLIFRPLSKLERISPIRPPIVLVVDALDECERMDGKDDARIILRLLSKAKDLENIQLRIFVTSRPEIPIRHGFNAMSGLAHQDCILHNIAQSVIERDISIFIKDEFGNIRKKRHLPIEWPGEQRISLLVHYADGLFIYAATICRFIDAFRPEKRLAQVLQPSAINTAAKRTSPTQKLDEMYTTVLKSSMYGRYYEDEQEELVKLFKQVIGTIVILSNTLSSAALTRLLALPDGDVYEILDHLHAVLDIPDSKELPIRLLHPSFRDFLLDEERCLDNQLWIDKEQAHGYVAEHCMLLMSHGLKRHICGVHKPGFLSIDARHLVDKHLPSDLRYACCYWVYHLQQSNTMLYDNCQAHKFLQQHFLHWLEVLSLIRKITEGIQMVTVLHSLLTVCNNLCFVLL